MPSVESVQSLLELFLLREYPRGSYLSVSPQFYQKVYAVASAVQLPCVVERPKQMVLTQELPTPPIVPLVVQPTVEPVTKELPPPMVPETGPQVEQIVSSLPIEEKESVVGGSVEEHKWKRFFSVYYPKVQIREEILSDALAKKQKELYRTTIFLLLGEGEETNVEFFQKITDAITDRFRSALCLPATVWREKVRDASWREKGELFLVEQEAHGWLQKEGIFLEPVILLDAFKTYQQEPQKKAPLWQAICSRLCKLQK